MTSQQWIEKAKTHRDKLRHLVGSYHPSVLRPHKPTDRVAPTITAPSAEIACEVVRQQVREDWQNRIGGAVEHFDESLNKGDSAEVATILNQAWFGVPETTSCWQIPGFREAVDLLEDLPEEEPA